jgi:GNAT superfamily N-acetyltransferase
MNELQIKAATKSDAPVVLDFIKKLAEFENLMHEVSATEEDLRNTLFSDNSNTEAIIGYLDETPIAFAIFFHNYSTFLGKKGLYLEDLFVLPDYRGNGIGEKMLKHLAKLALSRDCGRFEWSVLDWNEPAIKFYESFGAELKKEWITTRISGESLKALAKL